MSDSKTSPVPPFFPSLQRIDIEAGGVRFAGVMGGDGPPLLLIHGYPQTHIAWRKLAPELAKHYTVVIPDLPGYGSSRPHEMSPRWSKRRVGDALVALMTHLGHDRFAIVGHDRGARVGYRLALDHATRVLAYASLTVIPTADAMAAVDYRSAARAFHWFFFAQESDLPERLLAADPDAFIDRALVKMTDGRDIIEPAALDAYRAAFRDPLVRHAICEDYRAALNEDLELDNADLAAGRKMPCPVLVLWPEADQVPGQQTPLDIWRRWASNVSGTATSGGHLQPEDAPEEVLESVRPFLEQLTSLARRR
jgi:haloacetate dehalogenase